jgi:large subunit ribosomal protein L14
MIIKESNVSIADNSGALVARVMHSYSSPFSSVGDIVKVSIKKCKPNSKVSKGEKYLAVLVRSKSQISRKDGSSVSFSDNSVVLIKQDGSMVGTAVFGPVAQEVRDRFLKISSLAHDVV